MAGIFLILTIYHGYLTISDFYSMNKVKFPGLTACMKFACQRVKTEESILKTF